MTDCFIVTHFFIWGS